METNPADVIEGIVCETRPTLQEIRKMPQDLTRDKVGNEKSRERAEEYEGVEPKTCEGSPDSVPRGIKAVDNVLGKKTRERLRESERLAARVKALEDDEDNAYSKLQEAIAKRDSYKEELDKKEENFQERFYEFQMGLKYKMSKERHELDGHIDTLKREAKAALDEKQAELENYKARLRGIEFELQHCQIEAFNAKSELAKALLERNESAKMNKELKRRHASISETNSNLLAELGALDTRRSQLTRERDLLRIRLAQLELDLHESKANEAKACSDYGLLKAELEHIATTRKSDDADLQTELDNLVHEHHRLVQENEHLKDRLEDDQAQRLIHMSNNRPIASRKVSVTSNMSIADEIGDYDLSDDELSDCDHTGNEEDAYNNDPSAAMDIVNLDPKDLASTQWESAVPANDTSRPMSRRQDSFYDNSSDEDSQIQYPASDDLLGPIVPKLTLHTHTAAHVVPYTPAVPALSLFMSTVEELPQFESKAVLPEHSDNKEDLVGIQVKYDDPSATKRKSTSRSPPLAAVVIPEPIDPLLALSNIKTVIDHVPRKIALSFSEPMSEAVSPTEPRAALLTLSGTQTVLDSTPLKPTLTLSEPDIQEISPSEPSTLLEPHGPLLALAVMNYSRKNCEWSFPVDVLESTVTPELRPSSLTMSDIETIVSRTPTEPEVPTCNSNLVENPYPFQTSSIQRDSGAAIDSSDYSVESDPPSPISPPTFTPHSTLGIVIQDPWISTPPQISSDSFRCNENRKQHDRRHYLLGTGPQPLIYFFPLVLAIAALVQYSRDLSNQLLLWESANGVGFSEGYSCSYDEAYGQGNLLLDLLPSQFWSGECRLPVMAFNAIISVFSFLVNCLIIGIRLAHLVLRL